MLISPARDPALDAAALRLPWQIVATLMIATLVAWSIHTWPPVPWGAIIGLASSAIIAFLANKGASRLLFAPLLALVFFAAIVGNEVAAHLVIGTCLYD